MSIAGSIRGHSLGATLSSNSRGLNRLVGRLSSGRRVDRAADDAASLGVATNLDTAVRSTRSAIRNAQNGIAMTEVAESAGGQVSDTLQRMRVVAVQASNGIYSGSQRDTLQLEFTGLRSEIARIASTLEFDGIALGNGSTTVVLVQAGIQSDASSRLGIKLGDLTVSTLGLTAVGVNTVTDARASLDLIDSALLSVSQYRSTLGATMNRLEASISSSQAYGQALEASSARILDADYAKESAELMKRQILMVAGGASLVHHRRIQGQAIRLLS